MGKIYKQVKNLILAVLVIPAAALGQTNNFEFIQHDTGYTGSEDIVFMYGDIFNISSSAQTLTVNKVEHSAPIGWNASICVDDQCFAPFQNAVTFTLGAGDTTEFSLDAFPYGTTGSGSWTITVVDSSTMEADSAQITIDVHPVAIDDNFSAPQAFKLSNIYPNPTNAWINFDLELDNSGDYRIVLYSMDGRELMTRSYSLRSGTNLIQWGMGSLPSGNYIISATGAGLPVSRQVSVIK